MLKVSSPLESQKQPEKCWCFTKVLFTLLLLKGFNYCTIATYYARLCRAVQMHMSECIAAHCFLPAETERFTSTSL